MRATIMEDGTPRWPPTSPTVADSGAWERAELQPIMRNLGRIVRRDQGPTSLTAWQQELAEGASACAAATACTWRVGEGGAPAAYAQSRTDCTAGSGPNIFGRGYACHNVMSAEDGRWRDMQPGHLEPNQREACSVGRFIRTIFMADDRQA